MIEITSTVKDINIIISHKDNYYRIYHNKGKVKLIGKIKAPMEGLDFYWELLKLIDDYTYKNKGN